MTGDHPLTAAAIAREAGLDAERVVDRRGARGAGTTSGSPRSSPRLHVVARSTPDQKVRLVRAARERRPDRGRHRRRRQRRAGAPPRRRRGGDGQRDAVAREAADLVLGDDSFATLMYGLAEGRRIVDNVQKGLVFLISTHVALLGFILIATICRVRPAAAAAPDPVDGAVHRPLDVGRVRARAGRARPDAPAAAAHAASPLLTDGILGADHAWPAASRAVAALVVMLDPRRRRRARALAGLHGPRRRPGVRAYANRSLRTRSTGCRRTGSCWPRPSAVVAIQAAIPYVPPLAEAFRATPLDASDWALVAVVALAPAVLAEVVDGRGRLWVA